MADLKTITPAKISNTERHALFQHFFRRLAAHRNSCELYAIAEVGYADPEVPTETRKLFIKEIDHWAQQLLNNAWVACEEPGEGSCPTLDPLSDTSVAHLPPLPPREHLSQTVNSILFLHITTSKSYSSHTRAFLATFATTDEHAIVDTLKHPDDALKRAQQQTERAKADEAEKGKTLRYVGMGLAGLAGGALIGVTGGLAAPVVGGAVSTLLGFFGVGGTAAGLLASGLAGSSVVCGTLFGVYGAKSSVALIERHMREVRDLALIPVRPPKETLAVRLCVSGWLGDEQDIVAPWTVYGEDCDTYALRWEVDALKDLANALMTLLKNKAFGYLKSEIIKRTALAGVMAILSPTWWLKIGQIIDNPWMNARALALKAGTVLGKLLQQRVFGTRPVTLTGYSLGALVIFEAMRYLAKLPPSESAHLVEDVFLFGLPASSDARMWASVRRVVAGRLVNGYCEQDYVLAVLSRASDASWGVAGLAPVQVRGVENVECMGVEGHLKWRGRIGQCLQDIRAPGIVHEEVEKQMRNVARKLDEEIDIDEKEAEKVVQEGQEKQIAQA